MDYDIKDIGLAEKGRLRAEWAQAEFRRERFGSLRVARRGWQLDANVLGGIPRALATASSASPFK